MIETDVDIGEENLMEKKNLKSDLLIQQVLNILVNSPEPEQTLFGGLGSCCLIHL